MFDERFSGIGFYEGDYFTRAFLYNFSLSSVNDFDHNRDFNSVEIQLLKDTSKVVTGNENLLRCEENEKYSDLNRSLWMNKWLFAAYGDEYKIGREKCGPLINSLMFYPWFEKDVNTLNEQEYYLQQCVTEVNPRFFCMIYSNDKL
jgi:hypothetical protein